MKLRKKQFFLVFLMMLAAACMVSVSGCRKKEPEQKDSSVAETQSQAVDNSIEWKGKRYVYNDDLTNIMFLGIDTSDMLEGFDIPGGAGQADCIMILSLDEAAGQARILQVNRNTMTDIDVYDFSGNYLEPLEGGGQITLQYAYSIGGESSCWAMKKTLGELLYGLPIDGYLAMNLEGIAEISTAIGGVDVTLQEDYIEVDPDYTKGSTIHLSGKKAEKFVRYRDINVFNSIEGRMHRQVEFVTGLISTMHRSGGKKLYDVLSPFLDSYIITDMDAEQIDAFANYEYLTDEVLYLPGEEVMGDVHEEFYVDEEKLQDLLIDTFYKEVE